jgi:hypothetical protein
VAAVIVGFMILRMGAVFSWDALRELMDEGVSDLEVAAIRETVRVTPGVVGLHELRTRRMAQKILIDAHVQVDGHISVSEGHRIGDEVRRRVLAAHDDVLDMLVHIDPENDIRAASSTRLPDRQELLAHLREVLADQELPEPAKVQLHYLGGRVEAEIYVALAAAPDPERWSGLERALAGRLADDPYFSKININWVSAPN